MTPELAMQIDYWASLIGAGLTCMFCAVLASLIFRARRQVKADRWLAFVLVTFSIICVYAVIRYVSEIVRIPFATSIIWFVIIGAELGASIALIEEHRERKRVREALEAQNRQNERASLDRWRDERMITEGD